MTGSPQARSRYQWHKRTLVVAAISFAIVAGYFTHRVIRRQWLLADLHAVGARVNCDSLRERLRRWSDYGDFDRTETEVELTNAEMDDDWLVRHHFLRGLEIEDLSCHEISDRWLAGLIDAHPLRRLFLFDCPVSEDVLDALHDCTTLELLQVDGSNLNDDGLARLPLEQIEVLHIQKTKVTAGGLVNLKRCRVLRFVSIDRSQFSGDVIDLLASLGTVTTVCLCGEDITDQDLMRLTRVPTLTGCSLSGTSTTEEGVEAFMTAIGRD